MEIVKPQIHQSALSTLSRCGYKFQRIYLDRDKEPQTTPLVVGRGTHSGIEKNLTNKINKGTLLTKEAVQDLTRDGFVKAWQETSVVLNEEERFVGINKTRDLCQDMTIKLSLEHHYVLAPKLHPVQVERKFVITSSTSKYDIAGTIDDDEGDSIRDTKTMEVNRGERDVHSSDQYTVYSFAKYVLDGKIPDKIWQDNLIKSNPVKLLSYETKRTKEDFAIFFERFNQYIKIIDSGIFTPANAAGFDSPCHYCGFAKEGSCPYFNSKRIFTQTQKPVNKKREDSSYGKDQRIIDLTSYLDAS